MQSIELDAAKALENGWKNFDSEKPESGEIVLFARPFLNNYGSWCLRYDTGFWLPEVVEAGKGNGVVLYHEYEDPWEPTIWLRVNLPFGSKCSSCKKEKE